MGKSWRKPYRNLRKSPGHAEHGDALDLKKRGEIAGNDVGEENWKHIISLKV